jgi:hypothetical protein
MSNRIAASQMTDRMDMAVWLPAAPRRHGALAAARAWMRQAMTSAVALPAGFREDVGLAAQVPGYDAVLDFEARRLRV